MRDSTRLAVVRLLPEAGRGTASALAFLVLATPVLSLVFTLASGRLVGSVPAAVRGGPGSPAGRILVGALVVLGASFVAQHLTAGVREVLAVAAGRRIDRRLRARLLTSTLGPSGVAHLEDPELLDRLEITRARNTGMTPGIAARAAVQVAVNRLAVLPPFFLLGGFRWWLPIVTGAVLLWMRVAMREHILLSVRAAIQQTPALRRSGYFVDLALLPSAAKETRIFGLGGWLGDRFAQHYLDAMRDVWHQRAASQRRLVLPVLTTLVANALAFVLVVRAATTGQIDLAQLTILMTSVGGMRMLLAIGNEDVELEQGAAVLPTLFEVERDLAERGEAMSGSRPATGLPAVAVRFEDVYFRYPRGDRDVYAGLDLDVRAGESLAVVGVNGAGKTTLVKLLARLHDPTSGRITVDGIDLRELDADAWQQRVAAIFQDFTHYELSAADNVGFGALALRDQPDELDAAIHSAGAGDIIAGLPAGWDTPLSRRFTGGTDLSGGQWQRIALARALLAVRNGAGILVLDEPTANLDVRAEAELYDRFLEITRGVTTVVISHRFSTVRRADRIVVLDAGRVAEDGTHDELVVAGGQYARMFTLQAARFTDLDRGEELTGG
ncbi:MAG TPA: ABC transporter ATP-binding protein [Acidimicrobiales bacterium]|nr:ABC transporter ATP-binding protein [Acidimicrobiales bacterium]